VPDEHGSHRWSSPSCARDDPETIDQVTLVASELVGNAVRHAGVDEGAEQKGKK